MQLRQLALIAAFVALPLAMTGSTPAAAAGCRCLAILSSGYCTRWERCPEVLMSVPTPVTPMRSVKQCPRTQTLVCDWNACTVTCPSKTGA